MTPTQQQLTDVLRDYGLGLQLAGVLIAAVGIRQVRVEWTTRLGITGTARTTAKSAMRTVIDWTSRHYSRLRKRPQTVDLQGVATRLRLAWGVADVTMALPPAPPADAPLPDRVAWLEQVTRIAFEHAENTRVQLAAERQARIGAVAAEQAARTDHAEQVRQSIGRLAGGGLSLQAMGVVYLLLGITLATIPERLATL